MLTAIEEKPPERGSRGLAVHLTPLYVQRPRISGAGRVPMRKHSIVFCLPTAVGPSRIRKSSPSVPHRCIHTCLHICEQTTVTTGRAVPHFSPMCRPPPRPLSRGGCARLRLKGRPNRHERVCSRGRGPGSICVRNRRTGGGQHRMWAFLPPLFPEELGSVGR